MTKFWKFGVLLVVLGISSSLWAEPPEKARQHLVVPSQADLAHDRLEVHFLDVGQGDSAIIRTPDHKTYMVDCGPRSARKKTIPYLKALGVEKLDGIFISHSHMDHLGSLPYMIDAFPVDAVYFSGYVHTSKYNEKALIKLKKMKIKMVKLKQGDKMELGGSVTLSVLSPPEDWNPELVDVNNYSVVLRFSLDEIDFLFMGDAERRAEQAILKSKLEIRSEFLKVGHHGSKTSSSELFLDNVLPLFAVISCGVANRFGHPDAKSIEHLQQRNVTIMRTDESGTVMVLTDGKKVFIKVKGKSWTPVSLNQGGRLHLVSIPGAIYGGLRYAC